MVKRVILGALVGTLVSWPVLAADDSVFLHCDGWIENTKGDPRHGVAVNVQIARDGSWIMWAGEKYSRSEISSKRDRWHYEIKFAKTNTSIFFTPTDMSLSSTGALDTGGGRHTSLYYCFPIENPFKF